MMGLLALQWTWEVVQWQLVAAVKNDNVHEIKANVCGMLSMFLWK